MYKSRHPRAGHVSPIIELLDADVKYQEELLIPLGIELILHWFSDQPTAIHFLLATWGHHGRPEIGRASCRERGSPEEETSAGVRKLSRTTMVDALEA